MDCPELYVVVLQQLLSPDDPAATVNEQLANPHNRSEWRLRTVLMPVSINSSDHLHAYLSAFWSDEIFEVVSISCGVIMGRGSYRFAC